MKDRGMRIAIVLGVMAVLLLSFAAVRFWDRLFPGGPPSLEGHWRMTLPAGFEHELRIESLGNNRYRYERLNSAGVYELRGDRLVIVEPKDERLHGFVWKIEDPNTLVLVEQPPTSKTGGSYIGATLTRLRER